MWDGLDDGTSQLAYTEPVPVCGPVKDADLVFEGGAAGDGAVVHVPTPSLSGSVGGGGGQGASGPAGGALSRRTKIETGGKGAPSYGLDAGPDNVGRQSEHPAS
jgi:hypothetical protein